VQDPALALVEFHQVPVLKYCP